MTRGLAWKRLCRGGAGVAGLAALLAGCAHRPVTVVPPPPPPVARAAPGYVARVDSLDSVDGAVLAGRRIVLDPGHGGFFAGAIGVNGLTEAAVNLGVALELKTLLEAHGASVLLTRTTDRDFLTPQDSTLRSDLAERSRMANAFGPDLFISIHHNADPGGAHDVNETRTYFKLGDEGASLDAANDMHRSLVRNLGIGTNRLLPGNYAVLRGSDAPALLTESSYITYPPTESLLVHEPARRLEAEALYLGLTRYFMRRVPVIESFAAFADGYPGADSSFVSERPGLMATVRGAFDQVELRLDGKPIVPLEMGNRLEWKPEAPLPMGFHEATLRVALAGEGWSRSHLRRFHITNAVGRLVVEFPNQYSWDGRQPLGVRVRALDQEDLPFTDSVFVRIHNVGRVPVVPADTQIVIRDGVGWGYFRLARGAVSRRALQVELRGRLHPMPTGEFDVPLVADARATLAFVRAMVPATRTGFARLEPDGGAVTGAPGTREPAPRVSWINRDGFVTLPRDANGAIAVPRLAGYRAVAADSAWPPRLAAIAAGALHGHRIAIDPAGGGTDPGGTSLSGTRGATLNLEVARALGALLEAAGADVVLTREADTPLSDIERVRIAEAFHPERFLRISHGASPPRAGYYVASNAGRRWSEATIAAFGALGLPTFAAAEDAQWVLQQTSCTSIAITPARVDDAASERRLLAPGTLRAEAYALFLGLAREWSTAGAWPIDTLVARDDAGQPVPGVAITLGGALVVQTDALGIALVARTEPGAIEAWVDDPRLRARGVLLDSSRVIVLTGNAGH